MPRDARAAVVTERSDRDAATEVVPLTPEDVDAAFGLSTAVGWNQTRDDWRRLLALAPDGAFGAFVDGRLVATATIERFPPALAWIGMVIVDPAMRGRRLGSAVMDAVLATDSARGGAIVGLDATDLGLPLYERRGFVAVAPMDRWTGVLRADGDATCEVQRLAPQEANGPDALDAVAAFDRKRAEVDRSRLLQHLLRDPSVEGWQVRRDGTTVGYALLRPGRTRAHLGPIVADDVGALRTLLHEAATALPGREVFVDALRHAATRAVFEAAGLHVVRRLTRMTRDRAVSVLVAEPLRAAVG